MSASEDDKLSVEEILGQMSYVLRFVVVHNP